MAIAEGIAGLPTQPNGGEEPDPIRPDIRPPDIAITSPPDPGTVPSDTEFWIQGTADDDYSGVRSVEVKIGAAPFVRVPVAEPGYATWAISAKLPHGAHTVTVRAYDNANNVRVLDRVLTAADSTGPLVSILHVSPATGEEVVPSTVRVSGTASDPETNLTKLEWSVSGGPWATIPGAWADWAFDLPLKKDQPVGGTPYVISVRATNEENRTTTTTFPIRAIDRTPPSVTIADPPDRFEIQGTAVSGTRMFTGTANDDLPDRLTAGIDYVDFRVDQGTFVRATPKAPGDWSTWTANVTIPGRDWHQVDIRCVDKQGNSNVVSQSHIVAVPVDVRDVGPRAYLSDLLEFGTRRVNGPGRRNTTVALIENLFHQPFAALAGPSVPFATEPVHQTRVCIDTLRSYLSPAPPPAVADWRFDENSGTLTKDRSGNGLHGTVVGPTWAPGRERSALRFDGVDDYVQMGAPSGLVMRDAMTIAAWIHPTGPGSPDIGGTIVCKEAEYEVARFADGTIRWAFANTTPGWTWTSTGYVAPLNTWTYVVVTYDRGQVRTFANGDLVHSANGTGPIGDVAPSENDFRVGARQHAPAVQFFQGLIDDVRIYDQALTPWEVNALLGVPVPEEVIWVDDALPPGARQGDEAWTWVTANPSPFMGTKCHQSVNAPGLHQHVFVLARPALVVNRGDTLYVYVFLDPANPPTEVMLQWDDLARGGWEHRAYWGADQIDWGISGTESRRYMGPLPHANRWVRLEVPASAVGLETAMVQGMAFTLFNGRASWDRAGRFGWRSRAGRGELAYRQAAYIDLLGRVGVSYEELRLARTAVPAEREALASRLGISLARARPDQLDRILLPFDRVTEADLERVFGLVSTAGGPLRRPVAEAELTTWQTERLRQVWAEQDTAAALAVPPAPPVIDPDIVGIADLRHPTTGNAAYDLWNERRRWIAAYVADLRTRRQAKPAAIDGFKEIVTLVLGTLDLDALAKARTDGRDISTTLADNQLSTAAFDYLLRLLALARSNSVLAWEWEDLYSILMQVLKVRHFGLWRAAERAKGVNLEPTFFVVPAPTVAAPPLPSWRASGSARQRWQRTLRGRLDQLSSLREALRTSVDETEEVALPLLRDALVAGAWGGRRDLDVAEALTGRLLIDVKASGAAKTSRVDQAAATLQGILAGVRSGRLPQAATRLGGTSVSRWAMDVRGTDYTEADFDAEWQWMGRYGMWTSAMSVFLYPENLLLPSLRDYSEAPDALDPTPAFQRRPNDETASFISRVRKEGTLTADSARTCAAYYLTDLRQGGQALPEQLKDPLFLITDQLGGIQLDDRATLSKTLLAGSTSLRAVPNLLTEVFYFVPLQLALQLRQSGQFEAALGWFRTIYAHNRPAGQRAIYYGFALEPKGTPSYQRPIDKWLLDSLNPHRIAPTRPHAHLRFTLLALARSLIDFADSEFTSDAPESLAQATGLYLEALDLLDAPELRPLEGSPGSPAPVPPNPVWVGLRNRAELNLAKLRNGRNLAGMQRQAVQSSTVAQPPATRTPGPTPYRYSTLIRRAQELVSHAQQVESAYLAALEKRDIEGYNKFRADQELELAGKNLLVQDQRVLLADGEVELAGLQMQRAEVQSETYGEWLASGLNEHEHKLLKSYEDIAFHRNLAATIDAYTTIAQTVLSASAERIPLATVTMGALSVLRTGNAYLLNEAEKQAQVSAFHASHERREQEWRLQRALANQDIKLAFVQHQLATGQKVLAETERAVVKLQSEHARAAAEYLAAKFTNGELYDWMSGVLGEVYAYLLQQATAIAQLAERQLAFERQEAPLGVVRTDYWHPASASNGSQPAVDRRGLTGSARLLHDLVSLDQHAFESNRRKLQLSQTFSLAQLAPVEFQHFRETGVLEFRTPMELFDRGFPGHYLRVIRQVRTSVVGLIPATQGIRATLTTSGISRVVVARDAFETISLARSPESVALTSPANASGVFDLDMQSELLLPFEGMGVDTSWRFELPKPANPFDFRNLADVLVTLDYTALSSLDYRRQILRGMAAEVNADRSYSLRYDFPDGWYNLVSATAPSALAITIDVRSDDFPPNVEELDLRHISLYLVGHRDPLPDIRAALRVTQGIATSPVTSPARSIDRIITTRNGTGTPWIPLTGGRSPVGQWQLTLVDDGVVRRKLQDGAIDDLVLVISYQAQTLPWPQ